MQVPFGNSGGQLEAGTDHARVASLPKTDAWWASHTGSVPAAAADEGSSGEEEGEEVVGESKVAANTPDPQCKTGLEANYHNHGVVVCCPKECEVCGAQNECQLPIKNGQPCPCAGRPGGADACCVSKIEDSKRRCSEEGQVICIHRLTHAHDRTDRQIHARIHTHRHGHSTQTHTHTYIILYWYLVNPRTLVGCGCAFL